MVPSIKLKNSKIDSEQVLWKKGAKIMYKNVYKILKFNTLSVDAICIGVPFV